MWYTNYKIGVEAKDGQVYFTLDSEGLRDQRDFNEWKSLYDGLHGNKWIMLHGVLDVALRLPKRDGFSAQLGVMAIN